MLTDSQLRDKWDNLPYQNNSYIRIDSEHLMDWHIGYESINQKSLLLIVKFEPPEVYSSKSIMSSIGERADGNWALSLKLIRKEHEEVFIRLCWDLIESSRIHENSLEGLDFVIHRYNQWAKLLENQNPSLLSISEQKGLIGEMHFLQKLIKEGLAMEEAVNGWVGSEGSDQDFVYSEKWYEIKSIGLSSNTVSISSLEQLDAPLPGELVINFIENTATTDSNAITLNRKVIQTRESLKGSYKAVTLFDEKLLKARYINLPEYDKQFFKIIGLNTYKIDDDFPKITRNSVSSQITAAEYQISIQAISHWKVK